jgi:hypothetical protein
LNEVHGLLSRDLTAMIFDVQAIWGPLPFPRLELMLFLAWDVVDVRDKAESTSHVIKSGFALWMGSASQKGTLSSSKEVEMSESQISFFQYGCPLFVELQALSFVLIIFVFCSSCGQLLTFL